MSRYDEHLRRAARVDTTVGALLLTAPADTVLFWPPRDRDRLALQRAESLRQETLGSARLGAPPGAPLT